MIKNPNEPLEYPAHYPPTDRWKKFFIGVRILGPDLSFFKYLEQQQSMRTSECMKVWENKAQEEMANLFGVLFKKWLRWQTPYFIPEDNFAVIVGGPKFQTIDDFELEEIIQEIETKLNIKLPVSFWQAAFDKTLGEVIEEICTIQSKA